jgi:hypothetical protein
MVSSAKMCRRVMPIAQAIPHRNSFVWAEVLPTLRKHGSPLKVAIPFRGDPLCRRPESGYDLIFQASLAPNLSGQ